MCIRDRTRTDQSSSLAGRTPTTQPNQLHKSGWLTSCVYREKVPPNTIYFTGSFHIRYVNQLSGDSIS